MQCEAFQDTWTSAAVWFTGSEYARPTGKQPKVRQQIKEAKDDPVLTEHLETAPQKVNTAKQQSLSLKDQRAKLVTEAKLLTSKVDKQTTVVEEAVYMARREAGGARRPGAQAAHTGGRGTGASIGHTRPTGQPKPSPHHGRPTRCEAGLRSQPTCCQDQSRQLRAMP
eukprot:6231273-Amphidinium_carterae.1